MAVAIDVNETNHDRNTGTQSDLETSTSPSALDAIYCYAARAAFRTLYGQGAVGQRSRERGLTAHSSRTMQKLRVRARVCLRVGSENVVGAPFGISTQNGNSQPPTSLTASACTV